MSRFDYLAIGHVTEDETPAGKKPGGSVAYAGRTAQALGCRTAVLTSAAADLDVDVALPQMTVERVPAGQTTTFENIYRGDTRRQVVHGVAASLTAEHLPAGWQRATIVHLGPVAGEIDPGMINLFSNSLVGVTPQGWLRRWDEEGNVYPARWQEARPVLKLAGAVILSEEDLLDRAMLDDFRRWTRLLVLTQGPAGCTVFLGDDHHQIPAPDVPEVDPTGAGDIFAAAFLVRLHQTDGNPWEAARFATRIAAEAVTRPGLDAKITHLQATLATD